MPGKVFIPFAPGLVIIGFNKLTDSRGPHLPLGTHTVSTGFEMRIDVTLRSA